MKKLHFVHLADKKIKMRVMATGIRYKITLSKFVQRDFPRGTKLATFVVRVFDTPEYKRVTVTVQAYDIEERYILDTTSKAHLALVLQLAETAIDKQIAEMLSIVEVNQ